WSFGLDELAPLDAQEPRPPFVDRQDTFAGAVEGQSANLSRAPAGAALSPGQDGAVEPPARDEAVVVARRQELAAGRDRHGGQGAVVLGPVAADADDLVVLDAE